jgi:hypothetical protein
VLDDLDRVKVYDTGTTPGQSAAKLTYQYDAFGNRTQMVQQTGSGASLISVTTNYTEYDYLNRLIKLNQSATNFPNWQNKSAKLDYRADSSLQTITRYSDLTQTTVVVKTDYTWRGLCPQPNLELKKVASRLGRVMVSTKPFLFGNRRHERVYRKASKLHQWSTEWSGPGQVSGDISLSRGARSDDEMAEPPQGTAEGFQTLC